jgi:probable rRNA maturation factor
MALALSFRNRQQLRAVELRFLRRVTRELLADFLQITEADLGFFLVAEPEMTRLNESFLHHAGSTDVITFDYASQGTADPQRVLHGEIFICVDEAVAQARRFRTSWQAEIVRYVVHGTLHLIGYDDRRVADRRRMKRTEDRLCADMAARFTLSRLARKPKLRA